MAKKKTGDKPAVAKARKPSNVPGQYLGFSLQPTRFLMRLLKASPGDSVCLEVFDDVGVERADGIRIAEQNKSNLTHNPLSDRAVDFWKTLGNWVDAVLKGELDLDTTHFEVYTSNKSGGPIAQSFHDANTPELAIGAIEAAEMALLGDGNGQAPQSLADDTKEHVERVLKADRKVVAKIVARFSFECGGGSPQDELNSITKHKLVSEECREEVIRWALGWVKRETDKLLEQGLPARLAYQTFHDALLNYVRTHDRIDFLKSFAGKKPAGDLNPETELQTYVRQLQIIEVGNEEVIEAVNDYMRAATDRTMWSEMGLINPESFDDYSEELSRSWRNKRDKVTIGYPHVAPVGRGRLLYRECIEHELPLDGMPTPAHFTRGSWHALADDESVGWHPDYPNELRRPTDPGSATGTDQ